MQGFRIVGIKQEKEGGNLYKLNAKNNEGERSQKGCKSLENMRLRTMTLKHKNEIGV